MDANERKKIMSVRSISLLIIVWVVIGIKQRQHRVRKGVYWDCYQNRKEAISIQKWSAKMGAVAAKLESADRTHQIIHFYIDKAVF